MSKKKKINDLSTDLIHEICVDFIVNSKTAKELAESYNMGLSSARNIINKFDLLQKQEDYKEHVLQKSVKKCADYHANIIYKSTNILNNHITQMSEKQEKQGEQMLSSADLRDVMSILSLISKEYRLDNDKPTDRSVNSVQLEFAGGYQGIDQRDIIDSESTQVKTTEESKDNPQESISDPQENQSQQKKEQESEDESTETEMDIDFENDILGGPIDDE